MKVIGWIVAVPLIFFGLFVALRFAFCRPNYFVVKTATPVAERIADYIVEHGLPERLDAIPGLPYEIKCKREIAYYKKENYRYIKVSDKNNSGKTIINETCYFNKGNDLYKIELWIVNFNDLKKNFYGDLKIISNKTSVGGSFRSTDGKKILFDGVGVGSLNHSGICRSFKQ